MSGRYLFLWCAAIVSLLAVLCVMGGHVSAQPVNDPIAALDVIAHLNAWRLEVGQWPLKVNSTLNDLAFSQAHYLSTLADIPSGTEMHLGISGERPRERAVQPPFNWPSYGSDGQAAISEVGAVGTLERALAFWRDSEIHRDTITSSVVREIGAAAVPHPWGHIFIVVFGSRPDVLPALVDPHSPTLYPTQDAFKWGPGNVPPMQVMLFDFSGRPLNGGAWLDWSPSIPLPEAAGETLYVLYSDGYRLSLAEVHLLRDQVILPADLATEEPSSSSG